MERFLKQKGHCPNEKIGFSQQQPKYDWDILLIKKNISCGPSVSNQIENISKCQCTTHTETAFGWFTLIKNFVFVVVFPNSIYVYIKIVLSSLVFDGHLFLIYGSINFNMLV